MVIINFLFLMFLFNMILPDSIYYSDYDLYMSAIYESDDEIYFELAIYEDYFDKEYYIGVLNKDSGEFSVLTDRNYDDSTYQLNYTQKYSGSNFIELNNPIFYFEDYDQYIDIRDNQVVELTEDCINTSKYADVCNILDNDIQVVLNYTGSDVYKLTLSNFASQQELTSYDFIESTTERNLYSSITSYNKYEENKVGIRIDFYSKDPYYFDGDGYIESRILEYTIDTNTLVELFVGPEYQYFNFEKNDNHYIFGSYEMLYKYDITNDVLSSDEPNMYILYNGYGYWSGYIDYQNTLFKYGTDLSINPVETIDLKNMLYPQMFSGDLIFEYVYNDSFWTYYKTYTVTNVLTGEVILEISENDSQFIENLLDNDESNSFI